jgi:hypothetical protein
VTVSDRMLRTTAVAFAVALLVHGADHLRRGMGASTAVAPRVNAFSWFSALFEIGADVAFGLVALQFLRRRAEVAA